MHADLHARLSAHAEAIGESRAGWVSRVLAAALDAEHAPVEFEPAAPGLGGRPPLPRINGKRVSESPFVDVPFGHTPACSRTISTAPTVLDGHVGGVALL